MGRGKWGVASGVWQMGSGKSGVTSGVRQVGCGKWGVASGVWQMGCDKWGATNGVRQIGCDKCEDWGVRLACSFLERVGEYGNIECAAREVEDLLEMLARDLAEIERQVPRHLPRLGEHAVEGVVILLEKSP